MAIINDMTKNIDVQNLEDAIGKFVSDRDWDQFHSVKNLAMALSVESSELLEIFQWMKEEDSNLVRNDASTISKVEDELADIFYFLILLSKKTGVDLDTALRKKLIKNAEKYPVERSRGHSKKYNEF